MHDLYSHSVEKIDMHAYKESLSVIPIVVQRFAIIYSTKNFLKYFFSSLGILMYVRFTDQKKYFQENEFV
jgi:hypothetical protein